MKIINASYEVLSVIDGNTILKNIEIAGRTCYKSEDKITETSSKEFVKMLISKGHESVLEHEKITVKFICDRGVSHEIVRHRLASFSQESTRYCNYSSNKFDNEITFIDIKNYLSSTAYDAWLTAMLNAEIRYKELINAGCSAQIARSVLPNSLKTEIVVTANLREWRLIFNQRTSIAAHPQMQEIMFPLLFCLKRVIPVVFDDIN